MYNVYSVWQQELHLDLWIYGLDDYAILKLVVIIHKNSCKMVIKAAIEQLKLEHIKKVYYVVLCFHRFK